MRDRKFRTGLLASLGILLAQGIPASAHADGQSTYYRFWRGVRRAGLDLSTLSLDLSQIFVPSTVALGMGRGLVAYLPVLLPEQKGNSLPDEVALVIYRDEASYRSLMATPEGQRYSASHWDYFDRSKSRSLVPQSYPLGAGTGVQVERSYLLEEDQPYDWQMNRNTVSIFTRSSGLSDSQYLADVTETLDQWKSEIDHNPNQGPIWDVFRAVVLVAQDYVILYEGEGIRATPLSWPSQGLTQAFSYPLTYSSAQDARLDPGSGLDIQF